jgi:hypothetical protein
MPTDFGVFTKGVNAWTQEAYSQILYNFKIQNGGKDDGYHTTNQLGWHGYQKSNIQGILSDLLQFTQAGRWPVEQKGTRDTTINMGRFQKRNIPSTPGGFFLVSVS